MLDIKALQRQRQSYLDSKISERELADECSMFESGDQWTDAQKAELARRGQAASVYNYVRRKVNALLGVEEQTRQDPKAYGRNPGIDEKSADVATAAVRYVSDNNDFPIVGMRSLHSGAVRGIGGVRLGIDMVDGHPEITMTPVNARYFFYDPRSERNDFSDAAFMGITKYISHDALLEMFADDKKAIEVINGLEIAGRENDDYQYDPRNDPILDAFDDRHFVVEHHYYHEGDWYVAYWCGNTIIKEFKSLYRDERGKTKPMFNMWSPYIDDDLVHFGEVKDMRDPQRGINKKISKILHLLSSNQTLRERGAVSDIDEFKRQKSLPDGDMEVNQGRMNAIQFLNNSAEISAYVNLLQMEMAEMDRTGPNNALTGRGTEHQSGVAIQEQKASGMSEISPGMQEFRRWKLRCYRMIWNMIRHYWTRSRIIRITDDEKAPQYIGLNQIEVVGSGVNARLEYKNHISKLDVDIILDEGPDTITLQQQDFADLMNIAPALANTPSAIPPEVLLQASRLRNKDKLVEAIEKNRQEMAQAQAGQAPSPEEMKQMQVLEMQKAQQELAEQAARTEKLKSEAAMTQAKIEEMRWKMEKERLEIAAQKEALAIEPPTQTIQ